MYGFDAISNHNGWAMAMVGATIVFCGLAILATLISLLPKLAGFLEQQQAKRSKADTDVTKIDQKTATNRFDADAVLAPLRAASTNLDEPFELAALYQVARKMDLPHPHLTISKLRQDGKLIGDKAHLFRWC